MEGGRTCLCISLHGACVFCVPVHQCMLSPCVVLCSCGTFQKVACMEWCEPAAVMGPFLVGQSTIDITFHIRKLMPSSVAKIQLAPVVLVGAICGCFMEGQAGNSALRQPGGGGGGVAVVG